jgi:hypothetical protein
VQKAIVMEDGCEGSMRQEACRSVYNGAMVHGVHAALQAYTTLGLELLALRRAAATASPEVRLLAKSDNASAIRLIL